MKFVETPMPQHRRVKSDALLSADRWEDAVSRSFVPLRVDRVAPDFRGAIRQHQFVGNANLSSVSCGASVLSRTARSALAESEPAILFVDHLDGRARVRQFDRVADQRPGDSVLYLTHQPYELSFANPITERVYRVPVSRIGIPLRKLEDLSARTFDAANVPFSVLRSYLRSLEHVASAPEAEALGSVAAELLRVALLSAAGEFRRPSPEADLASVKEFIKRSISDPELDAEKVASAFYISRRQVYVLFEHSSDTPAAYIRAARIARAQQIFGSIPDAAVSAVAFQSGFSDISTFRRAFKATTGMTAEEWRGQVHLRKARGFV